MNKIMTQSLSRREMLGAALTVSAFGWTANAALADDPPAPMPTPEEIKLRAFLNGKIVFERFVFSGETFPACHFDPPQAAEDYIGHYVLKTTFYNAQGRAVPTANKPGPYAAIIQLVPMQGRTSRRLVTLYRLAEDIPGDRHSMPDAFAALAAHTGIAPNVITGQTDLIAATCKERDWETLSYDPRVARLLAGLHQPLPDKKAGNSVGAQFIAPNANPAPPTNSAPNTDSIHNPQSTIVNRQSAPTPKNVDAFAAERQWWVRLKRKLAGTDRLYAHTPFGPEKVRGLSAPIVRPGSLSEAGFKPDAVEKIDAALQGWAGDTDQAFAVCIVRHGVIVMRKAYGMRDGKPMTTETKSWMASITKPMCATLMMMLVDRGVVGLDDPIEKYLPSLKGIQVETPITIRHLYTHTSGLDKWPGWSDEAPDVEEQLADCYPYVRVGKVWAYGGQGNTIGAKIIETVSGEALPLAYLHHLHGPLGNTQTDVIGAHADAFSVPLDIARFGQMLLNRGAYGNLRFFRPETFAQMLPQKLTKTLGPNATKTFGVGLDGTPISFGHGAASAATFHIETNRDLVVVMTRNNIGTNYDKYNGKFWQAINDSIT